MVKEYKRQTSRQASFARSLSKSISNLTSRLRRLGSSLSTKGDEKDIRDLVGQVKFKFYRDHNDQKDLFDHNDVVLIFENPHYKYAQRYLERQKYNVDKALEQIISVLKWRKAEGYSQMTDTTLPSFCWTYSMVFLYESDVDNNPVIHIRYKLYNKFSEEVVETYLRYLTHLVFKADQIGAERGCGWTVVVDMSNVSVRQFDLAFITFVIKMYLNYCPNGLKKIVIYNAHWLVKPLMKTALALLPSEISSNSYLVSGNDIFKYVPKENLPKYLNGTCKKDPLIAPEGCPEIEDYMKEHYPKAKNDLKEAIQKYVAADDHNIC